MAGLFRQFLRHAFPARTANRSADAPPPGTPDSVLYDAAGMLGPVVHAYERRLTQCGPTPKGAFWSNQENVRKRFDMLCRVFDPTDVARGGVTIRDFGCGYGALFDHIKDHPVMQGGSRYVGYDMTQSMLDACMRRIKDTRAEFRRSIRPQHAADYTMISGTFNMRLNAPDDEWLDYVEASLRILWETTTKALAVNMLDRRHKDILMDGLYYADRDTFVRFCRDSLSEDVRVHEDYGLPDFTVLIRREPGG